MPRSIARVVDVKTPLPDSAERSSARGPIRLRAQSKPRGIAGITLADVASTLAIIVLLATLSLMVYQAVTARSIAKSSSTKNRLKAFGTGLRIYATSPEWRSRLNRDTPTSAE